MVQRIAAIWEYSPALKFVLMAGIMSFFADFTYEGSRSITGPYLRLLGASAFTIRLFSGRGADRTGKYWPITIGGPGGNRRARPVDHSRGGLRPAGLPRRLLGHPGRRVAVGPAWSANWPPSR